MALVSAKLVFIIQHGIKSYYQAKISPWAFSSWDMALEEYGSLSYSLRESESHVFVCVWVAFPGGSELAFDKDI